MKPNYFLKMIGAADRDLDDRWIESRPELLKQFRTPKQPSSIKRGDIFVYYSAGTQKLFAIARSKINGSDAGMELEKDEERWPYVVPVQVIIAIPQLAFAPHWQVLDLPSSKVQQRSYVTISRESYLKAHAAMFEKSSEAGEDRG